MNLNLHLETQHKRCWCFM